MNEETNQPNPLFLHLVLSLQSAAMYQMGKIISPISGQIERDLEQARISIDLLIMLQEKTRGNLLEEEKRVLDSIIYNLQMNYVDEVNKDKIPGTQPAPETAPGQADEGSSSPAAS